MAASSTAPGVSIDDLALAALGACPICAVIWRRRCIAASRAA